ncbi:tyrosine-type recombinase/integrase [Staphylococcus pseudintermedius]|nr:tyrosine-type recombinase/integrase [Staphylococcus pseudintermedius]
MSVRKYGNKWYYDFGHEGKRYKKKGFKTKREATEAETKAKNDLLDGLIINNEITLYDYFKEWSQTYILPNVTAKTYDSYKTIQKHLTKHEIGSLKLTSISKAKYQKFINDFSKTHSKETIRKLNGKIKTSIDDAVHEGLLKKNFAYKINYTGCIPEKKEDDKFISLNDFKNLKSELKKQGSKSSMVLFIMVATGCRISGAINLKYDFINFKNNTIFIDEQKTDTSARTVEIAHEDMKYIMHWINKKPKNISGRVFDKITINAVNKSLNNTCEKLGIKKITSHAIRHTHCSFLLSKGVSIQYISKRLGHKNIKVTLEVYSHLLEESFEEENKKAVSLLNVI